MLGCGIGGEAHGDVEDRLGDDAGNGRGSDVLDCNGEFSQRVAYGCGEAFERDRPRRIAVSKSYLSVGQSEDQTPRFEAARAESDCW